MKLFNFYKDDEIHLGIVDEDGTARDATAGGYPAIPAAMQTTIDGTYTLDAIRTAAKNGPVVDIDTVRFAPAVLNPEKILCIGLNYAAHAKESKLPIPDYPTLFSKFNNALNAHKEPIVLPDTAYKYDYEVELVIVIGKTAHMVDKEDALDYVFGYTIGNDFSARDLQMRTPQWLIGKTFDGFAPLGPYIVPAAEADPAHFHVQSFVNGELRQDSNTNDLIFDCATIVSYLSQYMTLKPGDVIFTGTPSGVILGYPENQQVWLKAGDTVTVKIDGIGELTNTLTK